MKFGDRLSSRARARWASVLGVLTAATLISVSLVALNESVLPFNNWPDVTSEEQGGSLVLPAAPTPGVDGTGGVSAEGFSGIGGGVAALPGAGTTAAAPGLAPGAAGAGTGTDSAFGARTEGPQTTDSGSGLTGFAADSDDDGLKDRDERLIGTDPRAPTAMATGCPTAGSPSTTRTR
jgi:hypothetical protein